MKKKKIPFYSNENLLKVIKTNREEDEENEGNYGFDLADLKERQFEFNKRQMTVIDKLKEKKDE